MWILGIGLYEVHWSLFLDFYVSLKRRLSQSKHSYLLFYSYILIRISKLLDLAARACLIHAWSRLIDLINHNNELFFISIHGTCMDHAWFSMTKKLIFSVIFRLIIIYKGILLGVSIPVQLKISIEGERKSFFISLIFPWFMDEYPWQNRLSIKLYFCLFL